MTRLTKRDGTQEEFQRSETEESLRRIGASEDVINSTLQHVNPTNDESTSSFRNRIATELRSRSPETARRYENSRRLDVNRSEDVAAGTARGQPDHPSPLRLEAGRDRQRPARQHVSGGEC